MRDQCAGPDTEQINFLLIECQDGGYYNSILSFDEMKDFIWKATRAQENSYTLAYSKLVTQCWKPGMYMTYPNGHIVCVTKEV